MTGRKLALIFLTLIFPLAMEAQESIHRSDSLQQNPTAVDDDPILSMLDSLSDLRFVQDNSFLNPEQAAITIEAGPVFSDSVYRNRIAGMNRQSPFRYVYNSQVRMFIDLYASRKRLLTARILGLSQIYFPLFEEELDKRNMPLELKYLAVIESALNPVANSRAGAKGLWQFMYGTGRVYGLKITSYVDDRFDPVKSTVAACEHLQDLYNIYGDWSLALAAYNSGAGNVNKAIRRAGGVKDFWVVQRYLPRETRSYVPAFIAASYVLTYAQEHRIPAIDPGILFYEIDTVTIHNPLTFEQISEFLQIPKDEIGFLNPSFKQGVIPATPDNPYSVRLRKKHIGNFIANENTIFGYKTREGIEKDSLLSLAYDSFRDTKQYVVRSGETMSSVAKKFHMSVQELKSLNNLSKNSVKPRQRLLVYTTPSKYKPPVTSTPGTGSAPASAVSQKEEKEPATESGPQVHTVKSGEYLGKIAATYGCSVSQIMQWNNMKSSTIHTGQKLIVSGNGKTSSGTAAVSPKSSQPSQKYTWYTIKSGDTLWDIAEAFDVTIGQIKSLNKMRNGSRIQPGQKIKIPN